MPLPPTEPPSCVIAILSPHRDDAAFSCSLLMSRCLERGVGVTVVNVYTRSAYAPYLPECTVEEVTRVRAEEDAQLLEALGRGCRMVDLGLDDAPLRLECLTEAVLQAPLSEERAEGEARALAERLRPVLEGHALVVAPLGLGGHVDHAIVREAALRALPHDCGERLLFYEDLPYAARMSETERTAHLHRVRAGRTREWTVEFTVGEALRKRRMLSLYRSQIAESVADEMAAYGAAQGGERVCGACDFSGAGGEAGGALVRLAEWLRGVHREAEMPVGMDEAAVTAR